MQEEWRDVVGYEGLYKVSNYGRIKNCIKNTETETKSKNYQIISLRKNGVKKYFQIHRLVAIAFIPNPENLPIVNHKDENPKNNKVDNLEWCTYWYNVNYGKGKDKRIENIKERMKRNILSENDEENKIGKEIRKIRILNNLLQNELAEMVGVSENTVSRWENGIRNVSKNKRNKLCEILKIKESEIFN